MIPVVNLAIGAVFKIVLTYFLTGFPSINVKGAAAGTVCAYLTASLLNMKAVQKYTGARFDLSLVLIRPGIAAVLMGAASWGVHRLLSPMLGNSLSTLLAVFAGVVIYAILIFVLRVITEEDLGRMPKGEKILKIIRKFNHK